MWQNVATLLRPARTQGLFLKIFRNIFVSSTNIAHVAKQVNIWKPWSRQQYCRPNVSSFCWLLRPSMLSSLCVAKKISKPQMVWRGPFAAEPRGPGKLRGRARTNQCDLGRTTMPHIFFVLPLMSQDGCKSRGERLHADHDFSSPTSFAQLIPRQDARLGFTISPNPGLHVKYLLPFTEPSFLPTAWIKWNH